MLSRAKNFSSCHWIRASLILVLVVANLTACGGPNHRDRPSGPGWIDLIVESEAQGSEILFHDDQTFVGLALNQTDPLVNFQVELNHPKKMTLGGCYLRKVDRPTRRGRIRYQVAEAETVLIEGSIPLPSGSGWWQQDIELPERYVGSVQIAIEVDVKTGHSVMIRDALVEQQTVSKVRETKAPQVLLISLDTLREDALGVFEGPWKTPNLDALAREGERWSPHYSGGGWTKPSHAVMLTGFRGDTHRMSLKDRVMDSGLPTVAGRFQAANVKTAGFVFDCKWLDPKWGFDRGFDEYTVTNWRAGRAIYQVSNWIEDNRRDPFFLFFHTFEPHSDWHRLPYESPGTTGAEIADRFDVPVYGRLDKRGGSKRLNDINNGLTDPLPNETEILRFLYGRGVEETDRALGELFSDLKEKGLWDNLLIVVTSDHGEAFYEHGRYLHGLMWNEIIRVPLLIKWPESRNSGKIGSFSTSSIDIGPTLLAHAGLDHGDLPGVPLQQLAEERPVAIGGPNRMVVDGDWKAILAGNMKEVLFLSNVRDDRGEKTNLLDLERERALVLLETAREFVQADVDLRDKYRSAETDTTAALSDEETAKLKALGYLE